MSTKKRSLEPYLIEVYKQFVAIKDNDYKQAQEVFKSVFEQVKQNMREQCNYFGKYSKQEMYAGSVYDGIKVSRMNEFDMNIVIRLPISYEDGDNGIMIENDRPGFVKMKITNAFDHLDKQQDWEKCHKVTRDWRDSEKYFLQNKFRQWLHGIVQKAINNMGGTVTVLGVRYLLTYKESGPAYTLYIRNDVQNEPFTLDVDLVPVIRFLLPRKPEGYRPLESKKANFWLAVPKPNKEVADKTMKNRCWRLSFQEHERELIKDCKSLKITIRLLKKLRDALGMKEIASYYIKTLFLWKAYEKKEEPSFWQNKLPFLYRTMVQELYKAIKDKQIKFFWHDNHNLISGLKPTLQKVYADKLKDVLDNIDANNIEKIVAALLTTDELAEFKKTELYQKLAISPESSQSIDLTRSDSLFSDDIESLRCQLKSLPNDTSKDKVADLESRIDDLEDRVSAVEIRMRNFEMDIMKLRNGVLVDAVRELAG